MTDDELISVQALLDEALRKCHTKRKLAEAIGTTEQNLQALLKGLRHLTAAQVIALASLVNAPAVSVLALDTIEREKDPKTREKLRAGFFKRGTLGAAVGALALAAAAASVPADAQAASLSELTRYTLCAVLCAVLLAWLRAGQQNSRLFRWKCQAQAVDVGRGLWATVRAPCLSARAPS